MTSDTRGDEVAAVTASRRSPEEWLRLTGHVPRRMDPVNRALWWRATDPATAARTRWFMNWHEFYALLPERPPGRRLERRRDLGDLRRGDRRLVGGADRGDGHRSDAGCPRSSRTASPIGRILPGRRGASSACPRTR